ncbi:MAG TPA: glutamate mutase L, partial [Candidatus Lustribacter sp.]|nr:glutamate mutase L [Candidatus Lustribacter sp.]
AGQDDRCLDAQGGEPAGVVEQDLLVAAVRAADEQDDVGLGAPRVKAPVVLAGNADAVPEAAALLRASGCRVTVTGNVLPEIGVIHPEPARSAIREVFLRHVIGGKGLSTGPRFASLVRAATPDAVLRGVEVLADTLVGDILVIDIGGATTDVYSCLTPEGEDASLRRNVVAPLWRARTVEGDLGMRWNARGIIEAAVREGMPPAPELVAWAERVASEPSYLPIDEREATLDRELARLAAVVAVRRHARPALAAEEPRPLANVVHVIGSGGVLRYGDPEGADDVLRAVTTDYAGGWRVPREAAVRVDRAYLLFAVGLLAHAGYGVQAALLAGRHLGVAHP